MLRDGIPDHDGRLPDPARLGEVFERVDADRRLWLVDGDRRVMRAAAAYDAGAAMELHRELGLAVSDIARRLGMTEPEVRGLIVHPEDRLIEDARRLIGW